MALRVITATSFNTENKLTNEQSMKLLTFLLVAAAMTTGSLLAQETTGQQIPVHITARNARLVAPSTVTATPQDTLVITLDNPSTVPSSMPAVQYFCLIEEYATFNSTSNLGIPLINGFSATGHFGTCIPTSISVNYQPNSNLGNGFFHALKITVTDDDGGMGGPIFSSSCFITIIPPQ